MKKTSILAATLFALFAFPMFAEETKEESSDVAVETEAPEGTEENRLACPCQDKDDETASADEYIAFSDDEEKPAEGYLFASKEDEEEEDEVAQDALV